MNPVSVFYSYAHEDEPFRKKLVTHLAGLRREGLISEWHDRRIKPGSEWAGSIDEELNRALVILLLISPDFINSDYCIDKEMKRAVERHEAKQARVIPVIVREFDREIDPAIFPFMKLQFLPEEGRPIEAWDNEDAAFVSVAKGIRAVVQPLANARRETGDLRRAMNERERNWDAASQDETETAVLTGSEALRGAIAAADCAGIGDDAAIFAARGTLALAEDHYEEALQLFGSGEVDAAERRALAAARVADLALEEAVTKLLIVADAEFGLARWSDALEHYRRLMELLDRHPAAEVAGIDRQAVGGRIMNCNFQLFAEFSARRGVTNKFMAVRHYAALKKTILKNLGPLRSEPQVRFGWGGALRKDRTPRPWLKGVAAPGLLVEQQRMQDEGGPFVCLTSQAASFALGTNAHIDLETHPFLRWRWMAVELPENGDVRDPARIDEALSFALTFVDDSDAWHHFYYGWDTAAPVGTIASGGFFSMKWRMKVMTSGTAHLGEWVTCQRNVQQDIREAYDGAVVPKKLVMLTVQANCQYTGGSSTACIGELCFSTAQA